MTLDAHIEIGPSLIIVNNFLQIYTEVPLVLASTPMPVSCPMDVRKYSSSNEVAVSWDPPTAAGVPGLTTRTSTHCPGTMFPVGKTDVMYLFINDMGELGICTFEVTVIFGKYF